jgi:transcription elongation GreA/GreB family factor
VNKRALVRKVIAQLDAELELSAKSARAAHAEATDEQSKAENKYDTRGLEASYLARGQSLKAAETIEARRQLEKLTLRAFGPGDTIDLGAVVELEGAEGRECYFLGPAAGGAEVKHERKTVLVITPQSPFGRQLLGHRSGENVAVELAGSRRTYRIVTVV